MKQLVHGIVLMFLMASSLLVFGARVMGTQEYAASSSTGNAVVNGDFETGDFDGWAVDGICSISNTTVHGGSYAAYISDATYDNSITQTFFPMELAVDNGLTLDAWIYPNNVGELDAAYPSSGLLLRFYDSMTGQSALNVTYAWCWNTYVANGNGTSSTWFTLPGWSTGQWNQLQRNITADIQSYYGQTSFAGIYLDSIWIYYHYSGISPGAFWVDDISILAPMINSTPPTIIGVSRTPNVPNYDQNVAVSTFVYGADQCILSYTTDGVSWNNVSMSETGNIFNATIPAQLYNTTVQYEVYAYNSTIENWVESNIYSYTVSTIAPPPPPPLSVTVTPFDVVMISGQSLSFNSTVSGGTSPYTYQWNLNYAPVPNATSDSWTFTSTSYGSYTVCLIVTDSVGVIALSNMATVTVSTPPEVYFSVEPIAVAPLTDINASINGLETPSTRSPVGENFTVEIHLRNATTTNAPAGVQGVDVRFDFSSILNYCKPIGFTNELGQPGSAMNGPVDTLFSGFFNVFPYDDNVPLPPPYTNATQYVLVAASFDGSWNGNDGLVAKITFQITGQPLQNMSQPDFYGPLQIYFEQIVDANVNFVPAYVTQGTLRIDAAPSLVGDLNGDGKVGLQDLVLLAQAYGSKLGDPNWNPSADIAPPYGIISLTDLVTLAMHYGQHNP